MISQLQIHGRDGTAEVDAESSFLFITKMNLYKTLRNFPNVHREMKYVAGERKKRHQENIEIIQKKFEEHKRDIIRSKVQQDTKYDDAYNDINKKDNKKEDTPEKPDDFLNKLRQQLIKK